MSRCPFLFSHLIESSDALLNVMFETSITLLIFLVVLFQLTVLILKLLDFVFLYPKNYIFFLKIFLQKDVVNLISLLNDDQIIVCMGQLANIIFQLNKFLLHVLLVFSQIVFSFYTSFFLVFKIRQQFIMFLVFSIFKFSLRSNKMEDSFIICNALKLF